MSVMFRDSMVVSLLRFIITSVGQVSCNHLLWLKSSIQSSDKSDELRLDYISFIVTFTVSLFPSPSWSRFGFNFNIDVKTIYIEL